MVRNPKEGMKYSAFGVRKCEEHVERPYLSIQIFDKALALEIGQIMQARVKETFENANDVNSYQNARHEIKAFEEYIAGVKNAFPEIQFISTERKATNV